MVDPIEALLMYIYMVKWDKIVDPKMCFTDSHYYPMGYYSKYGYVW